MVSREHVIVEHRKSSGGRGTTILLLLLIGLAIEYWYVSLTLIAVAITCLVVSRRRKRGQRLRRPGKQDPFLNEVSVALRDLGLEEFARNTGNRLGGALLEGDVGLRGRGNEVWINLLLDRRFAHEAEMGLRANPQFRQTLDSGRRALKADGRVVCVARARGHGVADEILLDEVARTVTRISAGPGVPTVAGKPRTVPGTLDDFAALRQLNELREGGVISQAEFDAKKTELLERI